MKERSHPPALPHGPLRKLFDDVWVATGTMEMRRGFPRISFSRNMVVVRDGRALTLINSVRLDDRGLAALDELGKVEHVLRIAGFHGMDDPFYAARYGAKVWAVRGQMWTRGFDPPKKENSYFEAGVEMDEDTKLPIPGAKLFTFPSAKTPEGLVVLEREGGVVVSGDCMQHWHRTDEYFSTAGSLMMRTMGFIKPHNIGPGWLRAAKPSSPDLKRMLDLDFDHLLPAHGEPVLGGAKAAYRPSIERAAAR